MNGRYYFIFLLNVLCVISISEVYAQSAMINPSSRKCTSLNGQWQVIIDPTGIGNWREVWKEKKPHNKTDFIEYAFDESQTLSVPGDFNTQRPELTFYEGTIWYKLSFDYIKKDDLRLFLHFGAVNYMADIYLNGELIGSHEGGFTAFQFEITNQVKSEKNVIVVKVDNKRHHDGIPGNGYDWMNYGGITRDVNLIETNRTYIDDYSLQLAKEGKNNITGWIQLKGDQLSQKVSITIPELKYSFKTQTDSLGFAKIDFTTKIQRWSPASPKLYQVEIKSESDQVTDIIGFRTIKVVGTNVLLNDEPIFLKGVNIHEENPLKAAKAFSETDARLLLTWAKDLGCNLVRLAHYPHFEQMVKLAEEMGLMVWSEIPVYQHIEFSSEKVVKRMDLMLKEMIKRDRNRCGVVIWSLSNETYDFAPNRTKLLTEITKTCRTLDNSRIITHVLNSQGYHDSAVNVWDPLYETCDIISINEYMGWYIPWQSAPKDTKWEFKTPNKPVFISEFGGEAMFGSSDGPKDEAASWSEEYQEKIYIDQVEMFSTIPNLVGVCPWLLVDYRSLGRLHPKYQQGWNRKGLLSDHGEKKKAWYVMKQYYDSIPTKQK